MALVTFGLVSDVQYADIDNGTSFHGQMRYYRNALVLLRDAVQTWNSYNSSPSNSTKISFILNLGDIIDGKNKGKSEEAVDRVLQEFAEFKSGPAYHLLGNHCLYHLERSTLHPKYSFSFDPLSSSTTSSSSTSSDSSVPSVLSVSGSEDVIQQHHYFAFSPHPSMRFIALDTYDISLLGWPADHPHVKLASEILAQHNPNENKNSGIGMKGDQKRFVGFNGAIGPEQLKWLQQQLDDALSLKQKVILCSHVPLLQICSDSVSFLWNYTEVLDLIDKYPNVVCSLAGHEHDGGYVKRKNVHHLVVPAIIECTPDTNSYGIVEIFTDCILYIEAKHKQKYDNSKI